MSAPDPKRDRNDIKALIREMRNSDDYITTLNRALESATTNAPILTEVSIAVNTLLGGSLGTRSTRKQLQSLFHDVSGNLDMRVNSNSNIPSTYVLSLCAFIGDDKSKYNKFMKDLVNLLADGTAILDGGI